MAVVIEELETEMAAPAAEEAPRRPEAEEGEAMDERRVLETLARETWLAARVAVD